jgi:tetratricopeptide (TPR) repeat protein
MSASPELLRLLGWQDDPEPLHFLGEAGFLLLYLGRPKDALTVFDGLAALVPQDPTPWLGQGDALVEQGRLKPALECYQQAARAERGDARTLASCFRRQGEVQLRLGRAERARQCFEQAVSIDPQGAEGQAAKELLSRLPPTRGKPQEHRS